MSTMTTTTPTPSRRLIQVRSHPFNGARRMRPTRRHVPALWEGILGTIYASDGTETRYFDYRWDDARQFAGIPFTVPQHAVPAELDLRVARFDSPVGGPYSYRGVGSPGSPGPSRRQWVLWMVRPDGQALRGSR